VAIVSFFGSTTPPGTWTYGTDGDPSITTGTNFYFAAGSPARGASCVGGRWWCPAGQAGETVEFTLREGANDLPAFGTPGSNVTWGTTVVRTASVAVTDNTAHWLEATWPTPYTLSTAFRMLSVATTVTSNPDRYHFGASFRPGTDPVQSINMSTWYISEENLPTSGGYNHAWFRQGTASGYAATTGWYGHDALIDVVAGNAPPTANAGSDQTVTTGTLVTLNGSGSSDSDGFISTYSWTQTGGTSVTLSGSGSNRTFTPATAGVRTFQLTVTDDDGATNSDTVTVTVNAPGGGGNTPPTASAGPDQSVDTGAPVTLNGSGSSDTDGTVVGYTWTQVSGPSVTLSGTGANRTFTPTTAGTYIFGLTVTDDDGASSSQDTVTITATTSSGALTVAQENALTPTHGWEYWLEGIDTQSMPAFGRSTYYLPGQNFAMSVNYNLPFTFDVYRLGHYGGAGGRRVATGITGTPTAQPAPAVIANSNNAVTCAAWSVNGQWSIPIDATPGWYSVTLKGGTGSDFGQVLFCVSDKNNKKNVLIVTGDATWHAAYNGYGGNNIYGASTAIGSANARALCSTYDKPVITLNNVPQTHFFNNTYPYVKWSESVGINAGYTTIEQIKNDPSILDARGLIVWTGHNEYIPQQVMDKTKELLDSGTNMVNIAGNDFFWRVKFTNGSFESTTNGRNMWCKKDSLDGPSAIRTGGAGTPFTTSAEWTGTWQDTRWLLREPSYEFFGDQFIANGIRSDAVVVPFAMKTSPAWRNCPGIQSLGIGQVYAFAAGTLGMEWDQPHPSTELEWVPFSQNDIPLPSNASDENGAIYSQTATGQHRFMALVSGSAYVVNFNSDQWGWALDSLHLRGSAASDINARQMMLNVLYDLGAAGNGSMIVGSGLTIPTPVSNFGEAYGLTVIEPPPPVDPAGAYVTVVDTPTLDLSISGDGSEENPYVLSGVASPELGYSQSTRMFYSDGVKWHEL
jgi:hypothetical protein